MLTLLAKHAAMDLTVKAAGDLHVDQHHTVEDVGICLGQAMREALGDRAGHPPLRPRHAADGRDAGHLRGGPGRPGLLCLQAEFPAPKIGEFDSELVADFWQAFATNALCNLHVLVHYGRNGHHIAEAIFKAAARALCAWPSSPTRGFKACRAPRACCSSKGHAREKRQARYPVPDSLSRPEQPHVPAILPGRQVRST